MHTGQHGIHFEVKEILQEEFLKSIYEAIEQLKVIIKKEYKKRIRIVMLKDYFVEDSIHVEREFVDNLKLYKISVQPNMIMDIQPNWTDFEVYLSKLNKKYRQRYRVAREKASHIFKKELTLEKVAMESNRLHELYKNVSDNAKINTFILPKGHFLALKTHLKEEFKVFGYYLDNVLIGFYTLILNRDVLETYFLGYDKVHQYSNQMYLNMLYDMSDFAITNKFTSIVYARTAMEIKSSVGAQPKEMIVYLKHTNLLMNFGLNGIFKLMNPKQEWEERHPFKS
jgi:hypothetical protein